MAGFFFNILETVVGGLILTVVLFLLNEFAFPRNDLTGEWTSIVSVERTSHESYKNLSIQFTIHLLQKGYELVGSGEKTKDIMPDGKEVVFDFSKRTFIEIEGYYERKYFKRSQIKLNIIEKGKIRESRSTYFLKQIDKKTIAGNFTSTVANSSGRVKIKKS